MAEDTKTEAAPCTYEDVRAAIRSAWPEAAAAHGVDADAYGPVVDGHAAIGFSVRMYGPPTLEPNDETRAACAARDDMLRALEAHGFEVAVDDPTAHCRHLVRGWAAGLTARAAKPEAK